MKIIDLTTPYFVGQPYEYGVQHHIAHPMWPNSFIANETRSYEPDGSRFHVYTMYCEPGTRYMIRATETSLDTQPLDKLILRDAVVIDVPKGKYEGIYPEELEAAVKKAPVQRGDAFIVRTGWGDNERYLKMGHLYSDYAPHYTQSAARKLQELLKENGSNLFTYDCCDMGGAGGGRPKVDMATGERYGFAMDDGCASVGCVVNCGAITKPRVKLIILPLKIKGGGNFGPCGVVAIEE